MPADDWVTVEGQIVGFFDDDIAIVKVNSWKYAGNQNMSIPRFWLPIFCLRWLGNDYSFPYEQSENDEADVGRIIRFNTCEREQMDYASRLET